MSAHRNMNDSNTVCTLVCFNVKTFSYYQREKSSFDVKRHHITTIKLFIYQQKWGVNIMFNLAVIARPYYEYKLCKRCLCWFDQVRIVIIL